MIQPWRRRVRYLLIALFAGLPFLKVGGESALRFDVPTLRLHFFGASLWMDEFFLVLLVVLFATFLFISITLLFGRIWCGWLCPQIVFVDLTAAAGKKGKGRSGGASQAAAIFVSVVVGAVSVWYFVSPYDFLRDLAAGELGKVAAGSWIVLSVVTWLDLALVRQTFCATVCPYSRLQGVMLDRNSLVIAYDQARAGECIDCGACVKTCPCRHRYPRRAPGCLRQLRRVRRRLYANPGAQGILHAGGLLFWRPRWEVPPLAPGEPGRRRRRPRLSGHDSPGLPEP